MQSAFGAMLVEVRNGAALVNGKHVEPLAETVGAGREIGKWPVLLNASDCPVEVMQFAAVLKQSRLPA